MQHRARPLHYTKNGNGQHKPEVERAHDHDDAEGTRLGECAAERHGPQDDGELLVREGEGPEAEVGCCVGDAVEAEF